MTNAAKLATYRVEQLRLLAVGEREATADVIAHIAMRGGRPEAGAHG